MIDLPLDTEDTAAKVPDGTREKRGAFTRAMENKPWGTKRPRQDQLGDGDTSKPKSKKSKKAVTEPEANDGEHGEHSIPEEGRPERHISAVHRRKGRHSAVHVDRDADEGASDNSASSEESDSRPKVSDDDGEVDEEEGEGVTDPENLFDERAQIIDARRPSHKSSPSKRDSLNDDSQDEFPVVIPSGIKRKSQPTGVHSTKTKTVSPGTPTGTRTTNVDLNVAAHDERDDAKVYAAFQKKDGRKKARDDHYETDRVKVKEAKRPIKPLPSRARRDEKDASSDDSEAMWPEQAQMKYKKMKPGVRGGVRVNDQGDDMKKFLKQVCGVALGLTMFEKSFPDEEEQVKLYDRAISAAATTLNVPEINERTLVDSEFKKEIVDMISNRVCNLRSRLREKAVGIVSTAYGLVHLDQVERAALVESLINNLIYIYPLANRKNAASYDRGAPYMHSAIIALLYAHFFRGSKSYAKKYRKYFKSSVPDVDDQPEIPQAMLMLVCVAIHSVLKDDAATGQSQFSAEDGRDECLKHVSYINTRIKKTEGPDSLTLTEEQRKENMLRYHAVMAKLYRQAQRAPANPQGKDLKVADMPEVDIDLTAFNSD